MIEPQKKASADAESPEEILRSEGYIVSDPLADYLRRNWRQLTMTVVVALAIWFGYQMIRDTRDASLKASADTFAKVREKYGALTGVAARLKEAKARSVTKEEEVKKKTEEVARVEKELTESREKLLQTVEALSDGRSPYPELAALYRQLVSVQTGEALATPESPATSQWKSVDASSAQRFFAELAAISALRPMLDVASSNAAAKSELLALAKDGVFMNTAAALTLARVAQSKDEKIQVKEALNAIRVKEPSQIDLVTLEIERLESATAK